MDSWRPGAVAADLHTLTGVYALGALDGSEAAAFERHLAVCPDCAQEVRELTDTGVRLAAAVATAPPAELAAAVCARITVTRQNPPPVPTADGPRRARPVRRLLSRVRGAS